tara:strand:- start:3415 stop:4497 length:1083 start_codon:yes stop_codon:yes gene_type:complete
MKNYYIFFLGTKAQFIKTVPVINRIDDNNAEIYLYNTSQHYELTKNQIEKIHINYIEHKVTDNIKEIDTVSSLLYWFVKNLTYILFFKDENNTKFQKNAICIIHGNTISSLLGLLWSKKNKIKIAHIEGGYRSFNWLKPFPEEIIRYYVSKFSDYIFCFDETSKKNLEEMKIKGQIIKINKNTIYDTFENKTIKESNDSLIVSLHRNENIYSTKKLTEVVNLIIELNNDTFDTTIWYLHSQTKKRLLKSGLYTLLEDSGIQLNNLTEHDDFLQMLSSAKCVLTDGESVIEECKIIGVPTYSIINKLENPNSISNNIFLYNDFKKHEDFFNNLDLYKIASELNYNISPSKEISNYLQKVIN